MSEKIDETIVETPAGLAEAAERDRKLNEARTKVEAESKAIAAEIAKQEGAAATKFLRLGERCHKFMAKAKAAGYSTREARGMLEAEILIATRVDWSDEITRAIKVYHVHCHFGDGVLSLPLDMQKALSSFMTEDAETGEWGPMSRYADKIQKLYDSVTSGKKRTMTAKDFRAQLAMIKRPDQPSKASGASDSPAGENEETDQATDLGTPPDLVTPETAARLAVNQLFSSKDDINSCRMLGGQLTPEHVSEIFCGFVNRVREMTNQEAARGEWEHVLEIVQIRIAQMQEFFTKLKQRKSA